MYIEKNNNVKTRTTNTKHIFLFKKSTPHSIPLFIYHHSYCSKENTRKKGSKRGVAFCMTGEKRQSRFTLQQEEKSKAGKNVKRLLSYTEHKMLTFIQISLS